MDATRPTAVLPCTPALRDPALATVLAAFESDQLLRWVWPDYARYAVGAEAMFGLLLDLRIEAGVVSTATRDLDGGGVDAVARWDPPGGLARAVTAPVLAEADMAALPAYLETTTAGNVTVYRRLGFQVVREADVPGGGPHGFVMRRDPQTVAT